MMLCKADFEDLFPDLFPPEPAAPVDQKPVDAHQERIDPMQAIESVVGPAFRYGWPGLIMASAVAASAANDAVWKPLPAVERR